jgi:glutathione S-transferase
MLTVWGRKTSSNVQAVMWCIGELRLDFVRYDVGGRHRGNDAPEFLAMNPNGTVPVVKDGDGEPIWESAAILRYLASRYGVGSFWPSDLQARAGIDKWAEWSKINIALNFSVPIFWRVVRTAPKDRDQAAIGKAIAVLGRYFDLAEARLARSAFLCGDDFTLADIVFGHLLYRYFDIATDRPEHSALRRYYERLTERPAFREHVMVSYDELRVV